MKILFVTRGFPSEKDTMAGNYEAVQAKALAAKGLQVSVLSVYEDEKSPRKFNLNSQVSHRRVDGIDVYECTRLFINIRFIRRLNRYLRELSFKHIFNMYVKMQGVPDIVHAHIVSLAYHTIFAKEKLHIPFVITEHWTKTNVPEIPLWLKHFSNAYHQADRVICVSQALSDSLRRNFNVDSIVINNMVDDRFFQSVKVKCNDNSFKFIAIGAFRRNKGFDILIDAFAQAHFPPNISLNIVGDGEEREMIENKIKQYCLTEQIKLLGVKTPEEVNDLLSNSDCFVLSSRLETFAIVVIEAMAKGLPIIATRSGGPETYLQPEHGILIDKENVEQLTQAMKYMIEHYSEYNSIDIRKFCHDHFSSDVIADKIIFEYKQVLNQYE